VSIDKTVKSFDLLLKVITELEAESTSIEQHIIPDSRQNQLLKYSGEQSRIKKSEFNE